MKWKEMKNTSFEPIERKSDIVDECLDQVHIDLMDPMNMKNNNEEEYFFSFADVCSK